MIRFHLFLIIVFSLASKSMNAQKLPITIFQQDDTHSASYEETIRFYTEIAELSDLVSIEAKGMTDIGHPLHLITIEDKRYTDEKVKLFVNNAIHPGEPCGVDASQLWVKNILAEANKNELLKHCKIYIIPFYNIGGGLNRSSHSRANQQGPHRYGFRGNSKNLDLNRDFIKCDSKNAQSFNQIFSSCDPHIMVDTHTSNGADYQYTMTLIASQKDKLGPILGSYLQEDMIPFLYKNMEAKSWEMTPYVYSRGVPDGGIYGFLDNPRYSSGYASLHHCISFMPETHMLKPYADRVHSTLAFLETMADYINQKYASIITKKQESIQHYQSLKEAPLDWKQEDKVSEVLDFKGYKHGYKKSEITGRDRLYYDTSSPITIKVNFYNDYSPSKLINIPDAYLIPTAYTDVIDRLQWNGVVLSYYQPHESTALYYNYIENYESTPVPYEGHYLHSKVKTEEEKGKLALQQPYYIVKTNQPKRRYIIETLEPEAPDSYFAWNFFDGILMQKEHFSDYVFEDLAVEILENDPQLKNAFEQKKAEDTDFAEDAKAQLNYIYRHSPYFEKTYRRYPVLKIK